MFRTFAAFILLVAATGFSLHAQTADPGCPPPGEGCTGPSTIETETIVMESPYCEFTAQYRRTECNDGSYQLELLSITPGEGCDGYTELNYQGYSLSAFVEVAQLGIIQSLVQSGEAWQNLSSCDQSTSTVVQFYSANCWVWQKCTYEITGATPVCDTDPQPTVPPSEQIDIWTWHNCGRTCCKRTYEVCVNADISSFGRGVEIRNMTREKIGTCSDANKFQKPCQDGC